VSDLAERLEGSVRPDDLLGEVALAVANAFRARYVRVELDGRDGRRTVVERGDPAPLTHQLTLRYRGTVVGRMALSQPAGRLVGADARLLADLVRQAGVAAHAVTLNEELSASREQLVSSREEERRRLRRDLHDGLGPALGAVTLKVETARMLMHSDPDDADGVLVGVTEDIAATLADIRRLVHGLRPPALDEVGLAGALQQQAAKLSSAARGSPVDDLRIELDVDDRGDADPLPAAVEVAAYRIASEGMLNVRRHAQATTCSVRVRREEGSLVLEVSDDGVGLSAGATAGVGLVSVRERVAELGGTWALSGQQGGGTLLRATLPIQPLTHPTTLPPAATPQSSPAAVSADLMSLS
jgi:signal transduction histidine kinase